MSFSLLWLPVKISVFHITLSNRKKRKKKKTHTQTPGPALGQRNRDLLAGFRFDLVLMRYFSGVFYREENGVKRLMGECEALETGHGEKPLVSNDKGRDQGQAAQGLWSPERERRCRTTALGRTPTSLSSCSSTF